MFKLALSLEVKNGQELHTSFSLLTFPCCNFCGSMQHLKSVVHFCGCMIILALDMKVEELSASTDLLFSLHTLPYRAFCGRVQNFQSVVHFYGCISQVSIGCGNRGNVKIYIPVLLVVHFPLCEGAGASLSTRSGFLSTHPVLAKVEKIDSIDILLDSAMAAWAVSVGGT
jgi:hypothetical protein